MLMKLTPGVNSTKIIRAAFLHKSVWINFSLFNFNFLNFFGNMIFAKKLLVKCW